MGGAAAWAGEADSPETTKPGPRAGFKLAAWLRGTDSNRRPSGYEPDELPLLHPASGSVGTATRSVKQSRQLRRVRAPGEPSGLAAARQHWRLRRPGRRPPRRPRQHRRLRRQPQAPRPRRPEGRPRQASSAAGHHSSTTSSEPYHGPPADGVERRVENDLARPVQTGRGNGHETVTLGAGHGRPPDDRAIQSDAPPAALPVTARDRRRRAREATLT